jgi:hypothetical protein
MRPKSQRSPKKDILPPVDAEDMRQDRQRHLVSLALVPSSERIGLMLDDRIPRPEARRGSTLDLFFECKSALRELGARAAVGDDEALHCVLDLARKATMDLNGAVDAKPERMAGQAATMNAWPVLLPRNKSQARWTHVLLDRITLGSKSGTKWRRKGKVFDAFKPVNHVALGLRDEMEATQRRVNASMAILCAQATVQGGKFDPKRLEAMHDQLSREIAGLLPFSRDTWEAWFRCAWGLVMQKTKGHPEGDKKLCVLGEHRASRHQVERYEKRHDIKSFASASAIRTGIRDRLKASFKAMAQ